MTTKAKTSGAMILPQGMSEPEIYDLNWWVEILGTQALYKREQEVSQGVQYNLDQAREYVRIVSENDPDLKHIRVRVDLSEDDMSSRSVCFGEKSVVMASLFLSKTYGLNTLTILHELAHVKSRQLHGPKIEPHGKEFRYAYWQLLDKWFPDGAESLSEMVP